jgi:hypothetical protein
MNNDDQFKTPEERLAKLKDLNEDTDNENNRTANDRVESGNEERDILSVQGDDQEKQENLGGGTNLSLDQLKRGDAEQNNDDE